MPTDNQGKVTPAPIDYLAALQAVYASEIHFSIDAHWDEGFRAWIVTGGGICEFSGMLPTFVDAAAWVCEMAVKRWPQSAFASGWMWAGNLPKS